jgi:hypothetical protein
MKLIKELQTITGVAKFMPNAHKAESRVANTVNMPELYPNTICYPTIHFLRNGIINEWYANDRVS